MVHTVVMTTMKTAVFFRTRFSTVDAFFLIPTQTAWRWEWPPDWLRHIIAQDARGRAAERYIGPNRQRQQNPVNAPGVPSQTTACVVSPSSR